MKRGTALGSLGASALLGAAIVLGMPAVLLAGADYWKTAASGDFGTGSNWGDGSAPTASDSANFNLAGGYTVTFTSGVQNQELNVYQGAVTFTSSGGPWTYNLTAPTGSQDVNVTGGTLTLGTSGHPLHLTAGNDLSVQTGGTLNVKFGGDAFVDDVDIGVASSAFPSSLVVDGSGSNLSAAGGAHRMGFNGATGNLVLQNTASGSIGGTLYMATVNDGTANLTVQSAAQLTMGTLSAAPSNVVGQTATITVTGAGSQITQTGASSIGLGAEAQGTATINITSGGTFTTGTGETYLNKTGTINVNGGTFNANGDITISGGRLERTSAGAFTWVAGKNLSIYSGGRFIMPWFFTPANATINVNGTGSVFQTSLGYMYIDAGAQVNVSGGAAVSAAQAFQIGDVSDGTLVVDGPGSSASAGLPSRWGYSGGAASVAFRNSASGTFPGGIMLAGGDPGSNATVEVETGADLTVGAFQINTLGGDTSARVTVTDPGSTITHTAGSSLYLGHASTGTALLNVLSDAFYTVSDTGQTYLYPTGRIYIDGGTVNLGTLNQLGGVVTLARGSLTYKGNLTVGVGGLFGNTDVTLSNGQFLTLSGTTTVDPFWTLTLDGGRLSAGSLAVNGALNFNRGTLAITGAGGLGIGAGGPLGAAFTLLGGCTLNVTNTTTISAGSVLALRSGGVLNTGTLANNGELVLDGLTATASGTTFNNAGLIRGEGRITAAVNNNAGGEIRAELLKRLKLEGTNGVNAGKINLQGGTAEFVQALTNGPDGNILGRGTLITGGAGLTNRGDVALSNGTTDVHGDVLNDAGGRIIVSGKADVTFWDDVTHNGALFKVSAGSSATFFGNFSGSGIEGSGEKFFEADLSPGSSPGAANFGGNVTLGSLARLRIELGGTGPGTQYDTVAVEGIVTLDGTLDVGLIGGFRPAHNDQFTILTFGSRSGDFAAKTGLDLGGRLRLQPQYTPNSLVLSAVQGGSGTWRVDKAGLSSEPTNWAEGLPNAVGDAATFGPVITQPRTVTIDVPTTYGAIVFNNSHRYTVAGPQPITLATPAKRASIRADNAHGEGHTIAAQLNVASDLDIANHSDAALTISGHFNNAAGRQITFSGSGEVILSGPLSNAGNTAVRSGTLTYDIAAGNPVTVSATTLTIDPGATVLAGGDVDPFSSGTNHVDVLNNSMAAGLEITSGSKAIGGLLGTGMTTIEAGAELTASYVRQESVKLQGTPDHPARLVIRPSGHRLALPAAAPFPASTLAAPSAVPEPTCLALLIAAAAAALLCTRGRRQGYLPRRGRPARHPHSGAGPNPS